MIKNGTQMIFVERVNVINEVITLQEASEILNCADSTLRKQVLNGKFKEGEYRKAKGIILFNKSVIEEIAVSKI